MINRIMVRPRKTEVGKVITITMSPGTRKNLQYIADEERRSLSEIVTYLITKEYNLRKGGEGALKILDQMADAVIIQAHFRDRQTDIKPFLKLHDDIDAIRRALPEYKKRQEEETEKLKAIDEQVMEDNKKLWQKEDKKKMLSKKKKK